MPHISSTTALDFVGAAFGDDLHLKRLQSLANATKGALTCSRFGVAAIGRALAAANSLDPKHAIKQVDRLLSNEGLDPWELASAWVPFVVGKRKDIVVAIDWTDFDADDQTTITAHLVEKYQRTTPLIWKTIRKSELRGQRNENEDAVLERLRDTLPDGVRCTILADRGFGDAKLYEFLTGLGFEFVIRFRGVIKVESRDGEARPASDWVPPSGKPKLLRDARVTDERVQIGSVVCVKARKMKDSWCLAASSRAATAAAIVKLYGMRFSIEETFRDLKDPRFGRGLRELRIASPARRDRILLIAALAVALLSLLGMASERSGFDRRLRANTSTKRTHSLFFQGTYCYSAIPNMRDDRAVPLLEAFEEILQEHAQLAGILRLFNF
jgi:hypothetical protein